MLVNNDDQEFNDLQKELLASIAQLASIQFYKQVVSQMEKHRTILKLIKQKKRVQKELVNAQHVHKQGQVALLSQQLQEIDTALLDIPLYQQYLRAIEEAQEDLDNVSEYIQNELTVKCTESEE